MAISSSSTPGYPTSTPMPISPPTPSSSPTSSSSSGSNYDTGFYEPPPTPGYTGNLNTGSSNAGTSPSDNGQTGGVSDSSMGNSASS